MTTPALRILLVGNDEKDKLTIEDLLGALPGSGVAVTPIGSAGEAIEQIRSEPFDICLLDHQLGGTSGLELLEKVGDQLNRPPIILLMATWNEELALAASRLGAADYLVKDRLDADRIDRSFRFVLERHQLEKERHQLEKERHQLEKERHQLEKERHQLEKERSAFQERMLSRNHLEALGRMVGGIAHDFNNLLQIISGNIDLLGAMTADIEGSKGHVEITLGACERARQIVAQMTLFSGKHKSDPEKIQLREVIHSTSPLLQAAIPRGSWYETDLDPKTPKCWANLAEIKAALVDLVLNAGQALEGGQGVVTIRCGGDRIQRGDVRTLVPGLEVGFGNFAFIEVEDDGIGISPEVAARVFDPLFSQNSTGRGLGLSAVLGTMRRHRGGIEIESLPKKGTRIRLLLPVAERTVTGPKRPTATSGKLGNEVGAPPHPDQDPTSARTKEPTSLEIPDRAADDETQGDEALRRSKLPGHRGLVLIVDDEPALVHVVRSTLERFGFRAAMALSGQEALRLFETLIDDIDVVILDFTMPEMTGEQVLRGMYARLGNRPSRPRFLISSGYPEAKVVAAMADFEVDGYLPKPYKLLDLVSEVRFLVTGRRVQYASWQDPEPLT